MNMEEQNNRSETPEVQDSAENEIERKDADPKTAEEPQTQSEDALDELARAYTDSSQADEAEGEQAVKTSANRIYTIIVAVLGIVAAVLAFIVVYQAITLNRNDDKPDGDTTVTNSSKPDGDTTSAADTTNKPADTDSSDIPETEIEFIESKYNVRDDLQTLGLYPSYDYDLTALLKLDDYSHITLDAAVTDEMLEAAIKAALKKEAELVDVTDRGAKEGDTLSITFEGFVDGSEKSDPNCTGKKEDLVIGSNALIPGFEVGLVGIKAGETRTLELTFPEKYDAKYAGKPVKFIVEVKSVKETVIPELNEAFVTAHTDYKTVAEYRDAMRKDLHESNYKTIRSNLEAKAWAALLEKTEYIAFPQKEYRNSYTYFFDYYSAYASYYGYSLEAFVTSLMNSTMEEFYQIADEQAVTQLRSDMLGFYIARSENMTISDEEYAAELESLAKQYGYDSGEAFEKEYTRDVIKSNMLFNKALDYIVAHTEIINAPANAAEWDAELEAEASEGAQ